MKIYFNIFFIFLLLFPVVSAEASQKDQTKIIERHFPVNSDALLEINNKYGNINLQTWDKNEIAFHIEIRAKGKNSDQVKDRLKSISIEFSGDRNKVSAKTIIQKSGFFSKRNSSEFSIVYTVKLPKTNHIALENEYGNIHIDELSGRSAIVLDYGNLQIERLNNSTNNFKLKYVTQATIDYIKSGSIRAEYGKLNIGKTESLTVVSKYTNLKLEHAKKLNAQMDYGNLLVDEIDQLSLKSDYTSIKIGALSQSLSSVNSYGSLNLAELKTGFEKIAIQTSYTNVFIGVKENAQYNFEAYISYGKAQLPNNLELSKQIEKPTQQIYAGQAGNSSGSIELKMKYGNPKIKLIP